MRRNCWRATFGENAPILAAHPPGQVDTVLGGSPRGFSFASSASSLAAVTFRAVRSTEC